VNFVTTTVGTPQTRTFTINNTGTAPLTLGAVTVPAGFTIVTPPAASVAAGGSTTVVVRLDASVAGNYSGTLTFTTNDSDENPFNFTISGNVNPVPVPEIEVLDGTTNIPDNTGSVNFGTTTVGTPVTKTFIKDLNHLVGKQLCIQIQLL
jgi:hypothetical protein